MEVAADRGREELRRLVGEDVEVPLVTGGVRRYVNLDFAASAPTLSTVADGVAELLPWYSSVHRGAGFKSRVSTELYERAREAVRSFVGASADDAVVFTRNTTDSINLLASALPDGAEVIAFAVEHHANLLPWRHGARGGTVRYLPVPADPASLLEHLEEALCEARGGSRMGPILVAATGASNVTGEIWPIAAIARLAHGHGASLLVDAAQLAPHVPIDMARDGVDFLALSGHKLYAPYGAGALVGRPDWLAAAEPFLLGGGAVKFVTLDDVLWAGLPDRQEAGSPNVVGAYALGLACETLAAIGMDLLAGEELAFHARARLRLAAVPGLELYRTWGFDLPHIGLVTFNLTGRNHAELAAILSAEFGIGVRHGCFCAHPLLLHLLRIDERAAGGIRDEIRRGGHPSMPGAVRMSFGLATTEADIDLAADALTEIAVHGPRWTYRRGDHGDDWDPDPDPRPWPSFMLRGPGSHREGSAALRSGLAGESS